jgi:hypothetical protein
VVGTEAVELRGSAIGEQIGAMLAEAFK